MPYYEGYQLKRKTKIECACGGRYTLGNRAEHYRTKKHTNWAEQQPTAAILSAVEQRDPKQCPHCSQWLKRPWTCERHIQNRACLRGSEGVYRAVSNSVRW